jgi:para-aminobenzoate synthetase component 1
LNNTTTTNSFPVTDLGEIKNKVLNWAQRFNTFCFLDNHQYHIEPHSRECLLGAGIRRKINASGEGALDLLQQFYDERRTWLFGHLSYELHVGEGQVPSSHPDLIRFPDLFYFEPEIIVSFNEHELIIEASAPQEIYEEIINSGDKKIQLQSNPHVRNRMDKGEYISVIRELKKHILRGDCYEINFCQEFFAENVILDPVAIYKKLTVISPNPFSGLYRLDDKWLICASPERFLKKEGSKILSQPIKGTSKRVAGNPKEDDKNKERLFSSDKDRSENVMVVDLVRNDLSMLCREGSVKVEELYGIYSFPQVHQMISTVSGELRRNVSLSEIIRATFPMGSMTGAPKKRVIELIAQYEKTRRGIFSGCLGYIAPNGDFDLNVVIRSLMYNSLTKYLSFQAGSGITFYSDPEKEWEECMLKAEAIKTALS